MHEFSVFKDLFERNAPGITKTTAWVIDRVTNGKNADVIQRIRTESDADKRKVLKEGLTSFAFSGTFSRRADNAILHHSGLMVGDFDHVKDIDVLRQQIRDDPYTYLMFLSPSGDGLKVVFKVPPNIKEHKSRYKAFMRHFNRDEFDRKNSNLSRLCFESYDPDLYYNPDSEVFEDIVHDDIHDLAISKPLVPLTSDDAIIRKLLVWADRNHPVVEGQRNHSVYVLASAMNRCAVSKISAEEFLVGYAQEDFRREEIIKAVRSAYSNTKDHGTGAMNDDSTCDYIREMNRAGCSVEDISREITSKIPDKRERELAIERVVDEVDGTTFWEKSRKGAVSIDHLRFKSFLQDQGFYKLYPSGSLNYVFVRLRENMVSNTSDKIVKDFVMRHIERIGDRAVFNYMAGRSSLFKEDYLNMLDAIDVDFAKDTKEYGTLYYRNCAVRVFNTGEVKAIDYVDLGGYVWEDYIIDRDFVKQDQEDGDFNRFMDLVSSEKTERITAMRTTIGYLLHGYKDMSNNRAVIYNDGVINDSPNGGSGKGIICQAIGKVKRVFTLDGKTFSFDDGFPYQTIGADCQILVFDDVQKRFAFERLFSVITEGITLEKKNKDAVKIPVDRSPKIIITTNYTIDGKGGSHDRRKWEVEMAGHFNATHTPAMEFGRQLIRDWDEVQWRAFDNYMVNCLAVYLSKGLVSCAWDNLGARKFITETSHEFWEWTEGDRYKVDENIYRADQMELFVSEYPDYSSRGKYKLSGKKWAHWLDALGRYRGWVVQNERNQQGHYTRYVLPGSVPVEVENDIAPF